MDKKTVELLNQILTNAKKEVANLLSDIVKKSWSIQVHVFYGEGFGKKNVDYDSEGKVKSPNRVVKINGVDGLHRWLVNFKAAGFNYAEFQDVIFQGKTKQDIEVHSESKAVAKVCDELLSDYFDVLLKRVPSVKEDGKSSKEAQAENADLKKQLADLKQRMDAADSVTQAANSAKEELDSKTSEGSNSNTGSGEDLVKTLLDSGAKADLISYILKNIDQDQTESQLKKIKSDDLKAIVVSAQE